MLINEIREPQGSANSFSNDDQNGLLGSSFSVTAPRAYSQQNS